jgi:excisionase family DNA binding protein
MRYEQKSSDLMRKGLEPLLTARETASYLRISLYTLNRIEREGLLKPYRTPGGHRRYSRAMLDAYLEGSRKDREEPRKREATSSSSSDD